MVFTHKICIFKDTAGKDQRNMQTETLRYVYREIEAGSHSIPEV